MKISNAKMFMIIQLLSILIIGKSYSQEVTVQLDSAIIKDDLKVFVKLLGNNNVPECIEKYSLLNRTICFKSKKCFDYLINKKGVDVNQTCGYKSPVYFICKYGDLEMLKQLVAKGANLNPPKYEGRSLIEYAEKYKNKPVIEYLRSRTTEK